MPNNRQVTSISAQAESQPAPYRRVSEVGAQVEYQPAPRRQVSELGVAVEYRKRRSNRGKPFPTLIWAGTTVRKGIDMQNGNLIVEVTDIAVQSPSGESCALPDGLNFTRIYQQDRQPDYQFMGLGWTHNHRVSLAKITGTPNIVVVQMPNGGEAYFTETSANHYTGAVGVGAVVDWNPSTSRYTLTALDQSTYTFDAAGNLLSRRFASGDNWMYTYTSGKLSLVADDYGRQLQFAYLSAPGQYNDGQLWRVGDQTATGLGGGTPGGRYVEYSFTPQKSNGVPIASPKALLATVRDLRANLWTYDYYGQHTGETNAALLHLFTSRVSPNVDKDGDGLPDGPITQESLSYTLAGSSIAGISQALGAASPPLLQTDYAFQVGGQEVSTEVTAGKTTTYKFDNGLYAGTQDPAGNVSGQSNNFAFRPDVQTDPNGNPTALRWSADGKLLNSVTDALGNLTRFTYLSGGPSDGALDYSLDAQNRQTKYLYGDASNSRLPTDVKVFDTDGVTVLRWQKFTYDSRGRILTEQVVDPSNGTTVQQQVTRVYYTSGNGNGLLQTVTQQDLVNPANNVTTTYFYDSAGRIVQTNQSATFGSCTSAYTVYNAAGDVVATICNYDPGANPAPTTAAEAVALFNPALPDKNRVTTYEYDTLGRRVKVTTDAGASYAQTTLTAYDALDRVTRTITNYVADPNVPNPYTAARSAFAHGTDNTQNLVTDTAYNERGLVRSQTDVLGNVTLFGYDDAGRLVKTVASASQPAYNNTYGSGGDPTLGSYVASNAPDLDLVTSSQYDPAGNLVRSVDVLGNVAFTVYDALNRPVKTVRNAKDTATIALNPGDPGYDATNDPRSASYLDSASPDRDFIDVTEYDTLGRLRRTQGPLGSWTLFGYDALGRQVKVVLSASNPTYDMVADPSLAGYTPSSAADLDLVTATTYDNQGRVLYTTDVQGQRTWSAYDGLNRVVKTIVNAVGTATDGGVNDPRSASYVPSTDSDKDQISLTTYDANGRVQWTQDPHGNKTWYVYDSVGRQKKVIANCTYVSGTPAPEDDTYVGSSDADKDLISRTTFDGQGRVASTFDLVGNETRYIYDALGRRIQTIVNFVDGVFNPSFPDEDLISTTTYDVAGRVVTTTDPRGTPTSFVYDAASRRLKVIQAANTPLATTAYTCYDKGGRVLRTISNYLPAPTDPSPDAQDGSGNWLFAPTTHGLHEDTNLITTFTLDKAGRQTLVANPIGNTTSTVYFKDGQIQSVTDPEGMVTQYRYDAVRRRKIVVAGYQAGSFSDPATWYWDNGTSQWKDGSGTPITFGTNNDQNIIVVAAYDKPGRMTSLRDPRGNLTQYAYDLLSRRTSLTDPLSHVWTTAYTNVTGGTTRMTATDPLTFQTQQDFDRAGRLASVQYLAESPKNTPDVTFSYDKLGNRTHMDETATGGSTWVRKTTYTYDKARRLVSAGFDTDGNGSIDQTVSYQYDAGGLRTRLTLPGSLNVTYTYDARGQLVSLTDWASQATSYAYDNLGRLLAAIRANGLRSGYVYDCAGRLRQLRHSKGKKVYGHFAYEVDKRGNRIQALEAIPQAATGATTLLYNDPGVWYYLGNWTAANPYQTTSNVSAALKLAFFGDQATLTMGQGPDHSIYDIYIDAALWASIDGYAASAGDRVITIVLDNEGPHIVDIRNRPEKNAASSGYTLRFKSLATLAGASLYDLRTLKYAYDALARLIDAKYYLGVNTGVADANLPRRYQYAFDRAGNRIQQIASVNGTPTTTIYSYDDANRLASDGTNTYIHDNAGRLTSAAGFALTWDRANRLLSHAATNSSWLYNGLGQRLKKTVFGATTDYLLDVQPSLWHILASTDATGTTRFVHEPSGQHTIQYPAGAWYWPLPDALNSTRAVVDASLVVGGTREFSLYGDIVNQTGSFLTPFDFTGELVDPGPMNYLRAREYYPAPGRFLSLDPLEGDMSHPMSLNRYMYVQGNVVNMVDPSGQQCVDPGICAAISNVIMMEALGCIKRPPTQSGGVFTYTYARAAAALKAIDMATKKSLGYSFAASGTDSARFMSIALHAGGLPLTTTVDDNGKPNGCNTSSLNQTGWCVKTTAGGLEANSVFKNHNQEPAFTRDYNPASNHGLIGYLLGNTAVLGPGIKVNSTPTYLGVSDGQVFGGPNGDGITSFASTTDISAANLSAKYDYLKKHIADISFDNFCTGDYVWYAGGESHGAMIVGTGPVIDCQTKVPLGVSTQVPYIADLPGTQDGLPRPFYCTRIRQPAPYKYFVHNLWFFIKVPDSITVDSNRLFWPDPLS